MRLPRLDLRAHTTLQHPHTKLHLVRPLTPLSNHHSPPYSFFPSIVSSLGYSRTATLLLTAPPWFASFLACLCVTYHASRTRERCFHIVVPSLLALLGAALMIGSTRLPVRFVAMFLLPMGTLPAFQCVSLPTPRSSIC